MNIDNVYVEMLKTTLAGVNTGVISDSTLEMLGMDKPKNMRSIKFKSQVRRKLKDLIEDLPDTEGLDKREFNLVMYKGFLGFYKKDRFLENEKPIIKAKKVKIQPIVLKETKEVKEEIKITKRESSAYKFRLEDLVGRYAIETLKRTGSKKSRLLDKLKA